MDPNVTLNAIRNAIKGWVDAPDVETADCEALDLVDAIEALDGWLSAGGFLPNDWNGSRS